MLPSLKGVFYPKKDAYFLLPIILTFFLGTCITQLHIVAITMLTYCMFILPGYIFFKINNASNLKSIAYGAPLGFLITSLSIMIKVALTGWNLLSISIMYLILLCIIASTAHIMAHGKKYNPLADGRPGERNRHVPLAIFLIISLYIIMVFSPLSNVGKITEYGHAFTGLFSHDFILRGVTSIALANAIPPDNYYFAGQQIHNYYLLWFILPATVYNLIHMNGNIREIISVICLLNIPFFYLCLYYTLIDFINKDYTALEHHFRYDKAILIFLLMLFFYSYHWIFFAMKQITDAFGLEIFKPFFNQMGLLSQSWYRDIIFEPQTILSIMMIFLVLKFMSLPASFLRGAIIGFIVSGVALTDTAIFLIFGTAYFVFRIITMVIQWNFRSFLDLFATGLCGAIIAGLMFFVKIFVFSEYSNSIVLKPYMIIIAGLPLFLLLHYGVMPIVSLAGIKRRLFDNEGVFMIIIMFISILFMLFVTESLEGNVILRKSLKLLRLPLVLFAGYYIYHAKLTSTLRILILFLVLSLPTSLTDVYAITNVRNKQCTTYVSIEEMNAALWIKEHTPLNSVVQSLIDYPGYFDYSLTVCFGERKAALGLCKIAFLTYPNKKRIVERVHEIDSIFLTENNMRRYNTLKKLDIDYVFIGKREIEHYPLCDRRFNDDKKYIEMVFSNREVVIFKVL